MKRALGIGFFVLMIAFAFLSGAGKLQRAPKPMTTLVKGINPQLDLPITENKTLVIVIYAHNASLWCERALRSVFEQDYERYRVLFVDDASVDGTLEMAQRFIVDNQQDQRVIAIRNEEWQGMVGSLYRAADYVQNTDIMIPLDAQNWLSHDHVLSRLNQLFQNPDIWISVGQSIEYPSYSLTPAPVWDLQKRSSIASESIAFYAGLFKEIQLPDLLMEGRFSSVSAAYTLPLLEQSGGRFRALQEPLVFVNHSSPMRDRSSEENATILSRRPYSPLSQFPSSVASLAGVDVVLFSFDRPLQLYAALESIHRYVSGYQNLTVLYRASDARFKEAYHKVQATFPKVNYIQQSDEPRKDFKPLLMQILDAPASYIVFGVDDMVVKDFVDLNMCRQMLEKTGAYGFYLRFGRHIHQSFINQPEPTPSSISLSHSVFAWDLRQGEGDWGFANNLDMTIYRKKDLKPLFSAFKFKTPNSLESIWSKHPPVNFIGLYFEHSKMVNLPLNIVNASDCPHMNFMTAEELLIKFNQGFKMDIDPLYQIDNPSPHYEYAPDLILR